MKEGPFCGLYTICLQTGEYLDEKDFFQHFFTDKICEKKKQKFRGKWFPHPHSQ